MGDRECKLKAVRCVGVGDRKGRYGRWCLLLRCEGEDRAGSRGCWEEGKLEVASKVAEQGRVHPDTQVVLLHVEERRRARHQRDRT